MRLIDADALMKAIKNFRWVGVPNTLKLMFDYLKIIIRDQPTIEAAPVVYGQTEEIEPCRIAVDRQCCSCGAPMCSQDNYCPNCGARMDGDGDA